MSSESTEAPNNSKPFEYGKFFNIGPTTLMCIQENGATCIVDYEDLYPQMLIHSYDYDNETKDSEDLGSLEKPSARL